MQKKMISLVMVLVLVSVFDYGFSINCGTFCSSLSLGCDGGDVDLSCTSECDALDLSATMMTRCIDKLKGVKCENVHKKLKHCKVLETDVVNVDDCGALILDTSYDALPMERLYESWVKVQTEIDSKPAKFDTAVEVVKEASYTIASFFSEQGAGLVSEFLYNNFFSKGGKSYRDEFNARIAKTTVLNFFPLGSYFSTFFRFSAGPAQVYDSCLKSGFAKKSPYTAISYPHGTGPCSLPIGGYTKSTFGKYSGAILVDSKCNVVGSGTLYQYELHVGKPLNFLITVRHVYLLTSDRSLTWYVPSMAGPGQVPSKIYEMEGTDIGKGSVSVVTAVSKEDHDKFMKIIGSDMEQGLHLHAGGVSAVRNVEFSFSRFPTVNFESKQGQSGVAFVHKGNLCVLASYNIGVGTSNMYCVFSLPQFDMPKEKPVVVGRHLCHPVTDVNGDGKYDDSDCPFLWDINLNGKNDPEEDVNLDGKYDVTDFTHALASSSILNDTKRLRVGEVLEVCGKRFTAVEHPGRLFVKNITCSNFTSCATKLSGSVYRDTFQARFFVFLEIPTGFVGRGPNLLVSTAGHSFSFSDGVLVPKGHPWIGVVIFPDTCDFFS